ncbi:hypothetical protein ZHAS_00018875 [Anopheles sinensis]|uniref:Uncharacterized protein n=1 Tax=Anopheles sinensis TaxID=74873 RepID=A0A084WKS7_ANOSI|nr:hypothetical protein ZHAS_00018875 [Anopheles sinensis]
MSFVSYPAVPMVEVLLQKQQEQQRQPKQLQSSQVAIRRSVVVSVPSCSVSTVFAACVVARGGQCQCGPVPIAEEGGH